MSSESGQSRVGRRPLRVGLTGNIGAGKSSAAKLLEAHGAVVIDADELARAATEDPVVLADIATVLGGDLVRRAEDGSLRLDRAATAARVFADDEALAKLNAVVHPWVRRRTAELLAELERSPDPPLVVVHDIPLLYENDLQRGLDAVVVVYAPLEVRVARVVARSGLDPEEVRRRDAAQLPLEEKVARADFVIDNEAQRTMNRADGSDEPHRTVHADEDLLNEQVARLWRDLLELRKNLADLSDHH